MTCSLSIQSLGSMDSRSSSQFWGGRKSSATAMITLPVVAAAAAFQPATQVLAPLLTTTLTLGHFWASASAATKHSALHSSMPMHHSCWLSLLRVFQSSSTCGMMWGRTLVKAKEKMGAFSLIVSSVELETYGCGTRKRHHRHQIKGSGAEQPGAIGSRAG